ncbi:MAG: AsnC family transcriptional regulator [Bacteroidetes bacterium RIFCSPLOWO2_12_FULL_35_15]|nr:MAG: AsnC family transcriptional regulator [Bacteroidetes bacterium RIFCSPLOWO2_12_FULL_35_15]
MGKIKELDKIDLKILKHLQKDGCLSNLDLATKVGLSATPTFERVKKLEKAKIIKSYHAEVDVVALGMGIQTFMLVSLTQTQGNAVPNFIKEINSIPEIIECHHVTGSSDYVLKIMVEDIAAYERLAMGTIRNIKEISNMTTMVILSTIKNSKVAPLNYE